MMGQGVTLAVSHTGAAQRPGARPALFTIKQLQFFYGHPHRRFAVVPPQPNCVSKGGEIE